MRPAEGADTTLGDAERSEKLAELRSAEVLTEPEYHSEQRRLGLS
jgi:hypothetical protein